MPDPRAFVRYMAPPDEPPPQRVAEVMTTEAYARLLKAQGESLGVIAPKTGIPKTSLHRYLADTRK